MNSCGYHVPFANLIRIPLIRNTTYLAVNTFYEYISNVSNLLIEIIERRGSSPRKSRINFHQLQGAVV